MSSQHFYKSVLLLFIFLCGKTIGGKSFHLPGIQLAALSTQNELASDDQQELRASGNQVFLRVTTDMKNQSVSSGEKVIFKCKVEGSAKHKITYTWYKDNKVIDLNDKRISITDRDWGSRLRIANVFTLDAGNYLCEASNSLRRVKTQAHLKVTFARPPKFPVEERKSPLSNFFSSGKCEKYKGYVCAKYLNGIDIYVHAYGSLGDMNKQIKSALRKLAQPMVSERCRRYLLPAFCHFAIPTCGVSEEGNPTSGSLLCREDCEILKGDTCRREFGRDNKFVRDLFDTANCSLLSSYKEGGNCVRIGLTSQHQEEKCSDSEEKYEGSLNVASSGQTCKSWPTSMAAKHPELLGGHNFCRNPGNVRSQPWCYVDDQLTVVKTCDVKQCGDDSENTLVFIVVPCACAVLLLILCVFIYCKCRRHQSSTDVTKPSNPSKTHTTLIKRELKVPEVSPSSIQNLLEIGSSEYGKAYKGQIFNDPRFPDGFPVIVKSLDDATLFDNFMSEIEVLSELQHPNIMCLKAVSLHPDRQCMIFENLEVVDLHQHLISRSPNCDVTDTGAMGVVPHFDLTDIVKQVVSGLEYLSSHGFSHRDIAARNVSLCSDRTVKINLHGVIRDAYASNYYKPAANATCFPIRWMSSESIRFWQFMDKCDVYSFGVLLWEMYSFASQPFCGYSNREVLELISRGQLLTCPDQCPAKVYSLIHECWFAQPSQRPSFKEILVKVQNWPSDDVFINMEPLQMTSDAPSIISSVPPPDYSSIAPWNPSVAASERSFVSSASAAPRRMTTDRRYHGNGSHATEVTTLISASRDSGLPGDDLHLREDRNAESLLLYKPSNQEDGNLTT